MAYADDIILLSPSVKSLQFLIDKISELFNDHLLLLMWIKLLLLFLKESHILYQDILDCILMVKNWM